MDTMDMPCGLTFCLQDDSCLEDSEEVITCDECPFSVLTEDYFSSTEETASKGVSIL